MDAAQSLSLIAAGLDKIDQGVTVFDRNLELVFANRRIARMLDVPEDVMRVGASFAQVIGYNARRGEYGPGDPDEMIAERVARAREFKPHTFERLRPNGMVLRVSGWPLPQGGFASIYTDVTEQRRREARLQQEVLDRTVDLRRNEARLRLIANEVPAGIAYLDWRESFGFANARFARAYGLDVDSIVGLAAAAVLAPETMEISRPFFDRAKLGESVDFDHDVVLPGGRRIEVRTFLRPESEIGATKPGFYVLSVYVGRQKQAEAALLQAQKMEALGQLSSGIAHDFNNLLTVILGNLAPLEEQLRDRELRETLLAPALRAARRGADLTSRLLSVARRQPLTPRPIDAAEACRTIVALVQRTLPSGVSLTFETADEGAAVVYADPAQLENALLNLAVNARDAVGEAGAISFALAPKAIGPAEARTLNVAEGSYVEIRCRDDGDGVDPRVLDRVFEPFFTTKPAQVRAPIEAAGVGGTGLGLAIVHAFVRESRGAVTLGNLAGGRGAEAVLLLPAFEGGAQRDAETPAPGVGELRQVKGVLALLVDDEPEVRVVLRRDLVALGFEVVEAETGAEALELVETLEDLGLVVSDVAMPGGMSGVDLARRLAEIAPTLPVVLITGHGRDRVAEALPNGRQPLVLQKPVERSDLARALAAALPGDALDADPPSRRRA